MSVIYNFIHIFLSEFSYSRWIVPLFVRLWVSFSQPWDIWELCFGAGIWVPLDHPKRWSICIPWQQQGHVDSRSVGFVGGVGVRGTYGFHAGRLRTANVWAVCFYYQKHSKLPLKTPFLSLVKYACSFTSPRLSYDHSATLEPRSRIYYTYY